MKPLSVTELEKIVKSAEPEIAIHVAVHNRYDEFGYDKTQNWIRQTLKDWKWEKYFVIKEYLIKRVAENERFEPFRAELLKLLLDSGYKQLELWVNQMNINGFNKKEIYTILLELFVFIQCNPDTNADDTYSDKLSDFLDGFTAWGNGFKLLPDEPDL